ncbi:hypothetical protein BKA70DRAFT_359864 [Coprinopsis sp. MPI-PUGE-AT-0042]|nr:hypothetical protein BKA70DRAFT_359864 [Coprinopsis sp. MPI-PUGE-AT-0042]
MGITGSLIVLQNGHGSALIGEDLVLFRYKHGDYIPETGLSPEEIEALNRSYSHATFHLSQLLGNQDGHFRWGKGEEFPIKDRIRNVTQNESRLLAELRTDNNEWKWDGIDLDYRFRIGPEGEIFALESTKDPARVIAVGKPTFEPELLKRANVMTLQVPAEPKVLE